MIKNNKGVTMMTLVITIVVMIILISVTGYYSIDSIKNSYISREKNELSDIVEYVSVKKAKLLIDEMDVNEEFNDASGQSPVINIEELYLLASGLTETELNRIIEVNTYEDLTDNYKYLYITADMLNEQSFSTSDIVVKDVRNNYIINFYTGTVIALYDSGKRVEVSGIVKGLNDIIIEMQ